MEKFAVDVKDWACKWQLTATSGNMPPSFTLYRVPEVTVERAEKTYHVSIIWNSPVLNIYVRRSCTEDGYHRLGLQDHRMRGSRSNPCVWEVIAAHRCGVSTQSLGWWLFKILALARADRLVGPIAVFNHKVNRGYTGYWLSIHTPILWLYCLMNPWHAQTFEPPKSVVFRPLKYMALQACEPNFLGPEDACFFEVFACPGSPLMKLIGLIGTLPGCILSTSLNMFFTWDWDLQKP